MIFEALWESNKRGELLLIDGGYCRWHLRKDGQLTILEIISSRRGAGKEMLRSMQSKGADFIIARCPADLPSNEWWRKQGFILLTNEATKSGRKVNVWRFQL